MLRFLLAVSTKLFAASPGVGFTLVKCAPPSRMGCPHNPSWCSKNWIQSSRISRVTVSVFPPTKLSTVTGIRVQSCKMCPAVCSLHKVLHCHRNRASVLSKVLCPLLLVSTKLFTAPGIEFSLVECAQKSLGFLHKSPWAHLHMVGMLRLRVPFYRVLVSISVFVSLSTVFHSCLLTMFLPVFSLSYWFFQLHVSLWQSPSALI